MKSTPDRWKHFQYRGDARGIGQLYEEYNVDGFLSAREAGQREWGHSMRDRLLKDGVLLNEVLSPRIYRIVRSVQETLAVEGTFEVFCVRDADVNAFALLDHSSDQPRHLVGITSAALEHLEDDEISFLLGHELGHFLFGHNRLLGLLNQDERVEKVTVLPYLGECLFLRWRKTSEVSADRLGLVASGCFAAGARALVKAGFGLSDRNLDVNVDSLLRQIEAIKDKPEIIEAAYRSHPLLPLRLKALHLFSEALNQGDKADLAAVDDQIDALFEWFRRYPRRPLAEAVMRIVALAGMRIVGVEREIDEEEVRTVIYILHGHFTDTPEAELVLDPDERDRRWRAALEVLAREGDDSDRGFIISRLADIALADGKLLESEAGVILEIAEQIGMSPRMAYGVIVGAAQTVGFRVDHQLREITQRVRGQMANLVAEQGGFRPRTSPPRRPGTSDMLSSVKDLKDPGR
ncbi:MAG TPA: M48 family metalloprotease [Verrucomicrobiota bacterium]|nr:M48 family metalloprotease [Verrucomicrobiota bacterium]